MTNYLSKQKNLKLAFTQSTLDNYRGLFSASEDLEDMANIVTDLDDYAPGSTAIIDGANFEPGETVELQILHTDGTPNTGGGHNPWRVTDGGFADLDGTVDGRIKTNWYVNPDDSAGSAFELKAVGLNSGLVATHNFTDAGNPVPVQTFYVPLPEATVQTTLGNLFTDTGSTINSVISITSTTNDTYVYYDHWEDGYEVDISNPVQNSTQVWGDGDLTNGVAPGTTDDLLNEGDIVALENEVTLPRNSADTKYDGRDKIASSKAISVSRSAWATSPGTVLAGAVEVYDTAKYGTSFEIPIGQDVSSGEAFEYTSLSVTAASDNTQITINKNDGNGDIVQTLNEGETYLVNGGINAGATLTSTEPVQAHLVTGDVGAYYESRWLTLYPTEQWSNSYYSPVGTATSSDPTHIFVYNPDTAPLTVNYETLNGISSFDVPAGGVYRYQMPANSGARFYTDDEAKKFYAIGAIDADDASNATHDWGFSLVPESNLTPTVVIGWGPATADKSVNGSPIWVTAADATTIYVDYDGDSTTGALTDPNGKQYDISYDINKLESLRISDPNDFDQTGMRIYTADGTDITAAWGQDPSISGAGSPYLDMGTTVLPLPVASARKDAALTAAGDANNNGLFDPGDTIEYTITVKNDGVVVLGNVNITDIVPIGLDYIAGSTYITNSTFVNGTQVSDDGGSATAFPLDDNGIEDGIDGGFNIGNVPPGESASLTFQMQIDPTFTGSSITNSALVDSDDEDFNLDVNIAIANEPSTTEFVDDTGTQVAYYEENDTIYVEVTDPDPNNDINTAETVDVVITNPDTGDRETITLTETGNDTGVFGGSIPSSTSSGQSVEDGTVYAFAGNSLEVSYTDPSFTEDVSSDTVPAVAVPTDTKILYLSEGNDLDRIDPVNQGDVTDSDTGILGVNGLVGIDYGNNNVAPPNWSSNATNSTDLINEAGNNSPYDFNLSWGASAGAFIASPTAPSNQVPSHSQSLALLGGNVYHADSLQATWSDLNPELDYEVYVFSLNTDNTNQTVTITGSGTPISFAQNFAAGNLYVNNALGNSGNTLDSYAQVVTPNASGQIVIDIVDSAGASGNASIAGLAIVPVVEDSAIFNQSISMTSPFEMPVNAPISVTSYIDVSNNGTPTATNNIAATVSYGGGNIATFSNPTTITPVSGSIYEVTWQGVLGGDVSVAAGQDISLDITNNQAGLDFTVNYDSSTYPSKIELPTTTVIDVAALGVYDNSSAAGGGTLVDASFNGDTVYIRAEVTDPFGDADITGLDLVIDVPDGSQITASLDDTNVVDAPGDGTKIYEYEWNTGNVEGNYDVSVVANEGYETGDFKITDTAGTSFNLSALDLGTPSVTEFIDSAGNPVDTYTPLDSDIYLRVTDTDENADPNTLDTVTATITTSTGDSETVILTETGNDTGVFEVSIPSSALGGTTNNDGTINANNGTTLSASYTDADNVLDNTGDTATVLASPVLTNEPPVATDDINTTAENAVLNVDAANGVINFPSNPDTDPDLGDTLSVISVNGSSVVSAGSTIPLPSGAIVTMNPDGSYDYDPNGQFNYLGSGQEAVDTFEYTISDGKGGLDTATVSITITGVNEPPTAGDDSFTTLQGTAINLSAAAVTTNDSDPNGDALTIDSTTPATTANGGTVVLNPNGTITYTPDPAFIGVDSFDYVVDDGNGGTATATVSIEVQAPPTINLDPNNDGGGANDGNFETNYVGNPVNVADLDAADIANGLSDPDSPDLSFLNLTIGGVQDGANELLNIGSDGTTTGTYFSLAANSTNTVTVGSTTLRVTVSNNGSTVRIVNEAGGDIPQADLETLIQNITYSNNSLEPTPGDRTIDFTTSDGAYGSNTATSTITVPQINEPPINSVPTETQTISNSGNVVFSAENGNAISISDPNVDPTTDIVEVTLSAGNGIIDFATTNNLTITAGADASATITVQGTVDNINTALEALVYTPSGFGNDTISILTNDLGNSGLDPSDFGLPDTGDLDNEQDLDLINITNLATPTLDLDGDDTLLGNDFATAYVVGGSPISVSDDVLIGDLDDLNMQSATIQLTTRPDGDAAESLAVNGALPGGITTTGYDPVTGILELTGDATIENYQLAIAQIEYSNSTGLKLDDRTVEVIVSDGISNSNLATTTIAIDAPPFIDLDGDDHSFI